MVCRKDKEWAGDIRRGQVSILNRVVKTGHLKEVTGAKTSEDENHSENSYLG